MSFNYENAAKNFVTGLPKYEVLKSGSPRDRVAQAIQKGYGFGVLQFAYPGYCLEHRKEILDYIQYLRRGGYLKHLRPHDPSTPPKAKRVKVSSPTSSVNPVKE